MGDGETPILEAVVNIEIDHRDVTFRLSWGGYFAKDKGKSVNMYFPSRLVYSVRKETPAAKKTRGRCYSMGNVIYILRMWLLLSFYLVRLSQ